MIKKEQTKQAHTQNEKVLEQFQNYQNQYKDIRISYTNDQSPWLQTINRQKPIINNNNNNYNNAPLYKIFSAFQQEERDLLAENMLLRIIKILQRKFRLKMLNKKIQKLNKMKKYRRNVLLELVKSEQSYVADIYFLIDQVYDKLKAKKIVSAQTLVGIFSNIVTIHELNLSLMIALSNKYKSYDNKSQFCDTLLTYIPFFKLYFEYTSNYSNSQQLLSKTIANNQQFKEFIYDVVMKYPEFKNQDISSYLIKPVQRLPKYILLLKDLLKHTPTDHLDYQNIQKALTQFTQVNDQNNQRMDQRILNQKLFDIKQYGEHLNIQIVEPNRNFIGEEVLSAFIGGQFKNVTIYITTDLLIITERVIQFLTTEHKGIAYIKLQAKSTVKDLPDQLKHKYLFSVNGENDSITFRCESEENKTKIMDIIKDIILEIQKNLERAQSETAKKKLDQDIIPVEVNVLGTEERVQNLMRYTVYILEIILSTFTQKIFIRFSELKNLQKLVYHNYQLSLKLDNNSWFTNLDYQVIDNRKLSIETFLRSILNNPKIQADPEVVLRALTLDLNFFKKVQINKNEIMLTSPRTSYFSSKKRSICGEQIKEMINSISRRVTPNETPRSSFENQNSNTSSTTSILTQFKTQIQQCEQQLVLKIYENELKININVTDNTEMVMDKIAKSVCLLKFYDFRIFYEEGGYTKVLLEDEIVCKTLGDVKNSKFKQKKVCYFKKYIFLPVEIEQQQYQEDPKRLDLIYQQFFQELKVLNLVSFDLQCAFIAMVLIINLYFEVNDNNLPMELIEKCVSPVVFRNTKKETWITKLSSKLKDIIKKLLTFQQSNKISSQTVRICQDMFVFEYFLQNKFYAFQMFQIELQKANKDELPDSLIKDNENRYLLGVSFKEIQILDLKKKQCFLKFNTDLLIDFNHFTNVLILTTSQYKLKLHTVQTFQIYTLIELYVSLNDSLKNEENL